MINIESFYWNCVYYLFVYSLLPLLLQFDSIELKCQIVLLKIKILNVEMHFLTRFSRLVLTNNNFYLFIWFTHSLGKLWLVFVDSNGIVFTQQHIEHFFIFSTFNIFNYEIRESNIHFSSFFFHVNVWFRFVYISFIQSKGIIKNT